jgi:hypothetical protein
MRALALIVLAVLCGCPQTTPLGAAAVDGGACVAACAALTKATCPMGDAASCPAFMGTLSSGEAGAIANPATNRPLTCDDVAKVQTKLDAQKLGFICQ